MLLVFLMTGPFTSYLFYEVDFFLEISVSKEIFLENTEQSVVCTVCESQVILCSSRSLIIGGV